MKKTENFALNQWEPTDPVRPSDFNSDNAAIDAALKAVQDTAASKASAESVAALEQSMNSQITALTTALGSGGSNCRIAWGSYMGSGTYGAGSSNTLTFPFQPMLLYVCTPYDYSEAFFLRPNGRCGGSLNSSVVVTWGSSSVSWYSGNSSYDQFNESYIYYYVALGVNE